MPDSFFASEKTRKRKRSTAANDGAGSGVKTKHSTPHGPVASRGRGTGRGGRGGGSGVRTKPAGSRGRGTGRGASGARGSSERGGARKRMRGSMADEELSDQTNEGDVGGGIEDMDLRVGSDAELEGSGEEDEDETPAEKRLRLAKLYLQSVKEGISDGEFDAAEIDKELISARLKQDVMEHSGKVHLFLADSFDFTQPPGSVLRTRGHRLSVTSAVASEDGKYLFTSGKEGSIIKWDLLTGKKLATFHKHRPSKPAITNGKGKGKSKASGEDVKGHTDEIWALALSSDGKYLASGGKDKKVGVWDVEKGEWVKGFVAHKDSISALAFRKGSQQLYSGSFDRTLKLFDLSVLGYVETLFGHQDTVLALDTLRGETAVSVGARDKTVRYWKIVEESQLVFRGGGRSAVRELLDGGALEGLYDNAEPETLEGGEGLMVNGQRGKGRDRKDKAKKFVEGSIECVAMIDETTFVSGGDSGSICLWITQKKKPIFTQALAHGLNEVHSETEGLIQTPRWVTAISSLRYSDLIASGSWDGDVRIWKLDPKLKSFSLIGTVPAPGVVNSIQFISPPKNYIETISWATRSPNATDSMPVDVLHANTELDDSNPTPKRKAKGAPVFLVVGMGQEHRLGRWLKLQGEGTVNGAFVAAFLPRMFA